MNILISLKYTLQGKDGYDGAILVNPYNATAYLIKNGLWQKYVSEGMACSVIGVPKSEEWNAGVPDGSRARKDQAWGQDFERGTKIKYEDNVIYGYNWKESWWDPTEPVKFSSYFTVNSIATEHKQAGGTYSDYKFPKGDTYGGGNQKYCRQWFEGEKEFGEINSCAKQETEEFKGTIFGTNYTINAYDKTRNSSLHLYSDGGNSSNRNNYDKKSKVWVISHGMNNIWEDMRDLAESIKTAELEKGYNPIIILVDWSGAREGVTFPTDTDGWIRPTAEVLEPKLKEWGIENATELNFAGHSMGTMMINEIAKKLSNNANGMYFLDPPNFLPGTNNFVVDKRPEASNAAYDENNGYDKHYSKAAISRAFTGIKKNGDGNWCGNARLNRTARESISVYFPDYSETKAPVPFVGDDCAIHGNAIKAFSRIITDQKLTFDGSQKLNLHAQGVADYPKTQFYEDDSNFHSSIYVLGQNDVQTAMTKTPDTDNQLNIWGKLGGALYANFNYGMPNLNSQTRINIKTFGNNDNNWDRISLEKIALKPNVGQLTVYTSHYRVEGNTIKREVICSINYSSCPGISEFNEFVVEGDRSEEVTDKALSDKEPGIFQFRQQ